jgi:hypothetical protein
MREKSNGTTAHGVCIAFILAWDGDLMDVHLAG